MMPTNFSPYLRLIQKTGATKHPYGFSATDQLLKKTKLQPNSLVLDLGCGAGHTSSYVANRYGVKVTGIDISLEAIERAKALHMRDNHFSRMEFLVAEAANLPFNDDTFDVILCESVLIFIEDKALALNEINRVLKPGGYLALNEVCAREDDDNLQNLQAYFLREEFSGHLVTPSSLLKDITSNTWQIVLQNELPLDVMVQLKSDLKQFLSFKNVLPLFEMAHLAFVSKEIREDIASVIKFFYGLPKNTFSSLISLLLVAQKKPPHGGL